MTELAESARHTKAQLRLWLPLGRMFVAPFLFLFGPLRIRGSYRVPKKGPVLILANHLADVDPVVVQYACPRPIHFMAKEELFNMPFFGRMLRAFGSFPIKRGAPDRAALKFAASLLRDGEAVVVFPEGQLSENGELQEIKGGVALIVKMAAGVPIICCGLRGTDRMLPYGQMIPRPAFRTVEVTWGESRSFEKSTPHEEVLAWVEGQLKELSAEALEH